MTSTKVSGKTVRLSWTDGPTKGTTQAHHFYADGTVEWHSDDGEKKKTGATAEKGEPSKKPERPKYMAVDVGDGACLVSYLSQSGYTLTVALNFTDGSIVGVASNEKTWLPVRETFEVAK
ncbi:MAG: hypothetical protein ABI039_05135 [Vicinamibacterales bacterium]